MRHAKSVSVHTKYHHIIKSGRVYRICTVLMLVTTSTPATLIKLATIQPHLQSPCTSISRNSIKRVFLCITFPQSHFIILIILSIYNTQHIKGIQNNPYKYLTPYIHNKIISKTKKDFNSF